MRPTSLLVFLALLTPVLAGCGGETDSEAPREAAPVGEPVRIDVRDPERDSFRTSETVPVAEGRTVLDAMREMDAERLQMKVRGEGETAFVESLVGVDNEGGGENARNWMFWINGEFATTGAGAKRLDPGDRVEWRFVTGEEIKAETK